MHVRAALLRFSSASLGGGCLSSPISYTRRPTRPPPHPPGPGPVGQSLPRPAVSSRRSRSSSSRAAAAAPGPSSSPPPPPPRSPRSPRAEEGAAEGGRTGPSSSGGGTRTNSARRGSARPAGRLPRSAPPRRRAPPPPPRVPVRSPRPPALRLGPLPAGAGWRRARFRRRRRPATAQRPPAGGGVRGPSRWSPPGPQPSWGHRDCGRTKVAPRAVGGSVRGDRNLNMAMP